MKKARYDIVIVGAGPAGIFAVLELIKLNGGKKLTNKVALIEMGHRIEKRESREVMMGFGGAGTYSDGKLHYTPFLSHEKALHLIHVSEYQKILDQIFEIFKSYGIDSKMYPENLLEVKQLVEESEKNNIELVVRKAQHVGTNKLKAVIEKIQRYILSKGVILLDGIKIKDILVEDNVCTGVVDINGNQYLAPKILLAPGRISTRWLQEISKLHELKYQYDKVEVGVRVEFPASIMQRYADALYEVVFKIHSQTYDDVVRTFCSCPNGMVAIEQYDGYVCVNGHSNSDHKSKNSNFAFVCEVNLTEPVENSIAYAESIARLSSTIGGGKPILQRLEDLRRARRSTWHRLEKSLVTPSLREVTPGDIAMALPYRIVTNIKEGLEQLDAVMPGINSGSTLLYAPEVKYRSSKVSTTPDLQTSIKNLYVAGDASGLSGSITGAAATGIMAARGMS